MSRLILLIFTILAALGCQAEDFVIDIQQPRQTIRHFGASDAWSMQFIGKWENEQEQQKIADWLFSTENDEQGKPKGIGLSIWRFNLGSGSEEQRHRRYNREHEQSAFSRLMAPTTGASKPDNGNSCRWPNNGECPTSWLSLIHLQSISHKMDWQQIPGEEGPSICEMTAMMTLPTIWLRL